MGMQKVQGSASKGMGLHISRGVPYPVRQLWIRLGCRPARQARVAVFAGFPGKDVCSSVADDPAMQGSLKRSARLLTVLSLAAQVENRIRQRRPRTKYHRAVTHLPDRLPLAHGWRAPPRRTAWGYSSEVQQPHRVRTDLGGRWRTQDLRPERQVASTFDHRP
jgi:hypothetical protein